MYLFFEADCLRDLLPNFRLKIDDHVNQLHRVVRRAGLDAHLLHGGAVQGLFKLRQFRFFGGDLAGNAADLV